MRYIILLVLIILLAACSPKAEQGQPEIIIEKNPAVEPKKETSQLVDPTEIPTREPEVEPTPDVELTNLGPAPELTNQVWLNTDQPLRLADLKGKVVLLEMWTFG